MKKAVTSVCRLSQKMARQISECNETPGIKSGCHIADVQIFGGCQKGYVHNQCNRKPQQCAASVKQPEKRISERYRAFESGVFSDI